jgi:NADPH-dependent 2,4-dienoyl-CoA reductase/sulfur reductase-like enzyme/peroxiredoxin family protein/TusA-related sulfurtransferase/rhodanese-related sulfurtransferase
MHPAVVPFHFHNIVLVFSEITPYTLSKPAYGGMEAFMTEKRKVIIVGGVAGGASTATRLRRLDEQAEIIILERGEYVSFANCGLPYYIGGVITDRSLLSVQKPEDFRDSFNIDVRLHQEATAVDTAHKTVTIHDSAENRTYTESYTHLVLATGAAPVKLPVEGADSARVFTLRTIPDTDAIKQFISDKKPESAVVMGGGFIGVEMAENLHHAGLKVTIAEMLPQLVAPLDPDMMAEVHTYIRKSGIRLELGKGVSRIKDDGTKLQLTLSDSSLFETDMLIMAVGVRPDTKLAQEAGISVNAKGTIITDSRMMTSVPDVYAVGDDAEVADSVTGGRTYVALAGPANREGRVAADAICGLNSEYPGSQGSSILKIFDMAVASTGINEKTAKKLGIDYDIAITWSAEHASYYPGATYMAIKTVFERQTGRILGAQLTGFHGVDKRCDVFATAIRARMTASDIAELDLCYAPPFGSAKDPVNMAGFVIENIITGKMKQIRIEEVDGLPRDGSVYLIDVRDKVAFDNGHMQGFENIPLKEVRSRISSMDKTKKVYISCRIGLTAYTASRIFVQNGFDAYVISGGWRLYHAIYGKQTGPFESDGTGTKPQPEAADAAVSGTVPADTVIVDACGLQCPGPIVKLSDALKTVVPGSIVQITASDPAFPEDAESFCRQTGNTLLSSGEKAGICTLKIRKGCSTTAGGQSHAGTAGGTNKNIIVFSGDLDKAIASFIIANAAAAMGRKVTMFFTFWGLNILRKPGKVHVAKDFISKMFGRMMPRGSEKLGLSRMNMFGMGPKMIRSVMKKKNIDSLEQMIALAQKNGVELDACSMSMDVMGIKKEELIDGVKMVGAATMLANAEVSDMSLFI